MSWTLPVKFTQNLTDDKSTLVQVMTLVLSGSKPNLCGHMASLGHNELVVLNLCRFSKFWCYEWKIQMICRCWNAIVWTASQDQDPIWISWNFAWGLFFRGTLTISHQLLEKGGLVQNRKASLLYQWWQNQLFVIIHKTFIIHHSWYF